MISVAVTGSVRQRHGTLQTEHEQDQVRSLDDLKGNILDSMQGKCSGIGGEGLLAPMGQARPRNPQACFRRTGGLVHCRSVLGPDQEGSVKTLPGEEKYEALLYEIVSHVANMPLVIGERTGIW